MHGNKESIKLLLDNNCQLDIRFEGQTILSVIGSHFTDKKFECMVEILNLIGELSPKVVQVIYITNQTLSSVENNKIIM